MLNVNPLAMLPLPAPRPAFAPEKVYFDAE
jgi:hypothetical protein